VESPQPPPQAPQSAPAQSPEPPPQAPRAAPAESPEPTPQAPQPTSSESPELAPQAASAESSAPAPQPSAEAAPAETAAPAPERSGEPSGDAAPSGSTEPAAAGSAAESPAAPPAARQGGRGPGDRKRPERRRRPSPAQRHRNAFYAKLSELRRQDEAEQQGQLEGPTAEDAEAAPAAGEAQPPAPEAAPQQQQGGRVPLPGRAQARVRAAVERVGGEEAVREALAPKQRSDGQTMKWSAVCCDAAQGLSAGDPVFTAWARLAVTPVREIKNLVDPRDREGRGGRGGQRRGGGGRGGDRPWRDGGGQGGGYAGAEDMRQHGRDGSLKTRIRIVDMSKGRDDDRPDEGEAKKREAAERLDRLGY
jgi:hypothetical protein